MEEDPKTTQHPPQSQVHQLHTPVHLAGSTAGNSGQGSNEPRQGVAHLAMVVSDNSDFTYAPHQVIPTEDVFTVPAFPRDDLNGFNEGYLFPAEVTAFRGIYYQESGDVRPGYTGVSPFDYPLDHQGHMASKLHSGTVAYSSYIWLISTGIVYPQKRIQTSRLINTANSTSLGQSHLLPIMVSGVVCTSFP